MKHSFLRRAAAILAVCAVGISAFSITSFADTAPGYRPNPKYSEYEGTSLSLTQKTISMEEAENEQTITLTAKNNTGLGVASMGIHIMLDTGLEVTSRHVENVADGLAASGPRYHYDDCVFVDTMASKGAHISADGTDMWSFKVKVKDPKPGKRYNISVVYQDGDIFVNKENDNGEAQTDYVFTHIEQGYIQIEGEYDPSTDSSENVPEPILDRSSAPESSVSEESSEPESSVLESSKPESSKAKEKIEWLLGDVNNDKIIDIEDAVSEISHINGAKPLDEYEALRGDVDKNGNIDIEDAVAIISHVNGNNPITGKVTKPDEDDSSEAADPSSAEESSIPDSSSQADESSMPDDSSKIEKDPNAPELNEGEYWLTIYNDSPADQSFIYLKNTKYPEGMEFFNYEKEEIDISNKQIYGEGTNVSFGVRTPDGEYKKGNKITLAGYYGKYEFDPFEEDNGSHCIKVHCYENTKRVNEPELSEGEYWLSIINVSSTKSIDSMIKVDLNCNDEADFIEDFSTNKMYKDPHNIKDVRIQGTGYAKNFGLRDTAGEYRTGNEIKIIDPDDENNVLFSFDPFEHCDKNHRVVLYYNSEYDKPYFFDPENGGSAPIPELDNGEYWITINNTSKNSAGSTPIQVRTMPYGIPFNKRGIEGISSSTGQVFDSGDSLTFGIKDYRGTYEEGCTLLIYDTKGLSGLTKHEEKKEWERILQFDLYKFADENHRIVLNYDGTNWYVQ